ncbi:MAG: hypothetical protein A2138_22940 [Deltaproteobacteria bacterium RBG_16_71_12]|nr:MAG: hypothetical protein A2138_22940 [Deltaproteobacteria bacterium RBG_16_71_12]
MRTASRSVSSQSERTRSSARPTNVPLALLASDTTQPPWNNSVPCMREVRSLCTSRSALVVRPKV